MLDEEKPDYIKASYLDETVWDTREVEASIAAIGANEPQGIEYFGVTDHDQVWHEAVTEAAINAYQREFVSFTADWEGKLLVRGEPIQVQHPFVEGVATAALANRAGRVLTIDRDLDTPTQPYVIIRGKDGREWGPCKADSMTGRTITLNAADYAAVQADMGTLDSVDAISCSCVRCAKA